MNKNLPSAARALGAAVLLTLGACSSVPQSTLLDEARTNYNAAQSDPQVNALAAAELREAREALDRANAAQARRDEQRTVDHLAYLARQRVAIAAETARMKTAEAQIANANAERDRVLLAARTRDAVVAQQSADASRLQAEAAQRQAAYQERAAQAATVQAQAAQQQALTEQQRAEAATLQAQDAQARAAQLEAQLRDLEAKQTDRGIVVTLGDVLFDTGQATLRAGGQRNVQKVADFLKRYPQRKVLIEGFTDSVGGDAYNLDLSQRRAAAVGAALVGTGVAPERVVTRGYGKQYAVASNDSPAGRQLNRRVEIVISDDSGNIAPR